MNSVREISGQREREVNRERKRELDSVRVREREVNSKIDGLLPVHASS